MPGFERGPNWCIGGKCPYHCAKNGQMLYYNRIIYTGIYDCLMSKMQWIFNCHPWMFALEAIVFIINFFLGFNRHSSFLQLFRSTGSTQCSYRVFPHLSSEGSFTTGNFYSLTTTVLVNQLWKKWKKRAIHFNFVLIKKKNTPKVSFFSSNYASFP